MKFLFPLALALSFASPAAFAAGAVEYSCIGKNKVSGEAVVFSLMFSDHARDVGYTNEAITIEKSGGFNLEKPLVLQMFGASKKNECKKNEQGEILMSGKAFSMDPAQEGQPYSYRVKFKVSCGEEASFDVDAACEFNR